ncbi:hypothetical protein KC723_03520, partial [Candidatus Kaiserbacteria bacterium]|nr:hypothetical protein [Candidatus Kaiserbacteria bacterium]
GYQYGLVDSPYSKAIYVTDGENHFISRSKTKYGMYPVNYKFAEHLVDDKAVTKRVLKKFGFRVIKGKVFYINHSSEIKSKDNVRAAYQYAKKISYPVFVKPNNGSRGAFARIIFNETGMKQHVSDMRSGRVSSFLVEKFTERPEYRLFVVGGKVQFMYKKKRVSITGTGKHTIKELIQESEVKPDQNFLNDMLRWNKKTLQTILLQDTEFALQDTANISLGAQITDYREKIPKEIDKWANRLYKTIGLEVFGVDVFTKGDWDQPAKYLIIEVNSSPALAGIYSKGHTEKVFKIWRLIMKKYFLSLN